MKIDWKHLATTPGYQSLKAAYIKDVQDAEATRRRGHRPMRDKNIFLTLFNWVINRAKHHAYHRGVEIHVILDEWEKSRNGSWWLNHYGDYANRQGKLHNSPSIKLMKIETYYKKKSNYTVEYIKSELKRIKRNKAIEKRKQSGKKARWSMEVKKDRKRWK